MARSEAAGPLLRARLAAQGLTAGADLRPEQVTRRLLAVQAQDPRGARLAVRARSRGLIAADVDAALTDRRSLVVSWLNRGTLHLVAAEDYWWLHPLTTPQLATGNARRLRQEGVDPERADLGVRVVADAVGSHGPQTRQQLRSRLESRGVPTAGQALVHVLMAATLQGLVVRGPVVGGEHAYVSVPDWLGPPPPPLDRYVALARLAARYLEGHGPAAAGDLARWAGITLTDARVGMSAVERAVTREDLGAGLLDVPGRADGPAGELPGPRLLGAFDPLLLGWVSREEVVGPHRSLVTDNGLFRPFPLVGGRAVGTWGLSGGRVRLRPLEPVRRGVLADLRTDGADVLRFLGLPDRDVVVES